jgi:hypothetical protein
MCGPHSDDTTDDLGDDVEAGHSPWQLAAQRNAKAHGWIEVRARERAKNQDEHDENRAGRQRVA